MYNNITTFSLMQADAPPAATPSATPEKNNNMLMMLIPFLIVFVAIQWLSSRRQKKQEAEQKTKLDAAKAGDKVLLLGGLYGTLTAIKEKTINVEVAPKVVVEYDKSSIMEIINPETSATTEAK